MLCDAFFHLVIKQLFLINVLFLSPTRQVNTADYTSSFNGINTQSVYFFVVFLHLC